MCVYACVCECGLACVRVGLSARSRVFENVHVCACLCVSVRMCVCECVRARGCVCVCGVVTIKM